MNNAKNRNREGRALPAPAQVSDGVRAGYDGVTTHPEFGRKPVIFCAGPHHEPCPECVKAGRCAIAAGVREGGNG